MFLDDLGMSDPAQHRSMDMFASIIESSQFTNNPPVLLVNSRSDHLDHRLDLMQQKILQLQQLFIERDNNSKEIISRQAREIEDLHRQLQPKTMPGTGIPNVAESGESPPAADEGTSKERTKNMKTVGSRCNKVTW